MEQKTFDVAVVGSGPGGSVTAAYLAEAGLKTVLIEEGSRLENESCAPFSLLEMEQKYRNGGLTFAFGRPLISYVEGCVVGGGSEINSGLYHRTPPSILKDWEQKFQLQYASPELMEEHFHEIEKDISVSYLPGKLPKHSEKLIAGSNSLGWNCQEVPRWMKFGQDLDSQGVRIGSRQSMSRTFIPRFISAGGILKSDFRVEFLNFNYGCWLIEGQCKLSSSKSKIKAKNVFLTAGAIQTPHLMQKSKLKSSAGKTLSMHPTVKVICEFRDEITNLDSGVAVHQIKQFSPKFTLGSSVSTPPHLALSLNDSSYDLAKVKSWKNHSIYYAMLSGANSGRVQSLPGFKDPLVLYSITPKAQEELKLGLSKLCEVLLAAGSKCLLPVAFPGGTIEYANQIESYVSKVNFKKSPLSTIHLFSSCPMGEDQKICVTNSFGKVFGHENLHISDASILCSSPSVNPQGSIMAFARRNVLHFLRSI